MCECVCQIAAEPALWEVVLSKAGIVAFGAFGLWVLAKMGPPDDFKLAA